MRFTFKISERNYIDGYRLKIKSTIRSVLGYSIIALTFILWGIYIIGLVLKAFSKSPETHFWVNLGRSNLPMAIYLLTVLAIFKLLVPWNLHRNYQKNKNVQADFATDVTDEGIAQKASSGSSGFTVWSSISFWRESEGLFILVFPSKIYLIFPKSCLGEGGVDEFRLILAEHLPKK